MVVGVGGGGGGGGGGGLYWTPNRRLGPTYPSLWFDNDDDDDDVPFLQRITG